MKYFAYFYLIVHSLAYAATYPVTLGNTKVEIIKQGGKGKTFVHLHENEKTALAAAKTFVKSKGGTLITLQHSGKRNIVFHLRRVRYEFDPNRIFTDRGIKKTLKKFGSYSPAAHAEVRKFANKIKNLLPKNGKVVAVHNNRAYSIKEYFPKHPLAKDVKELNYRAKSNYRNFYFVTKTEEYRRLKKLKFNVALQAVNATDDGSLSFYLAKKNYINIESAFGALKEQIRMLYNA